MKSIEIMTPTRPYLLQAIYQWIVDNGMTPHLVVDTSIPGVEVPEDRIKDNRIVLNIHPDSIRELNMGKEWVTFDTRFSGVRRHLRLPMAAVKAVYTMENGRGMVFPEEEFPEPSSPTPFNEGGEAGKSRPKLTIVKPSS